jgi:hypothetical protein
LIEYYNRADGDTNILCMLTNMSFPARFVRASHIFKRSFEDELKLFGPELNIDHPRNGLLLLEPIEELYNRKDLCFLYNPTTQKLHAKLLNPKYEYLGMKAADGWCIISSYF